jgi:hypothetical protein
MPFVFVFVFCVGLAVTHRMYCSLPRLIVLTPLLVYPFHLQALSKSYDARDLSAKGGTVGKKISDQLRLLR